MRDRAHIVPVALIRGEAVFASDQSPDHSPRYVGICGPYFPSMYLKNSGELAILIFTSSCFEFHNFAAFSRLNTLSGSRKSCAYIAITASYL